MNYKFLLAIATVFIVSFTACKKDVDVTPPIEEPPVEIPPEELPPEGSDEEVSNLPCDGGFPCDPGIGSLVGDWMWHGPGVPSKITITPSGEIIDMKYDMYQISMDPASHLIFEGTTKVAQVRYSDDQTRMTWFVYPNEDNMVNVIGIETFEKL